MEKDKLFETLEVYGFKDNEAVKLQLQKPKERITKFAPQIVKDAKKGLRLSSFSKGVKKIAKEEGWRF